MTGNRSRSAVLLATAAAVMLAAATAFSVEPAPVPKPTMAKICTSCHKAEPNTLRGYFDSVAFKAKAIQMKIDEATVLVKFDEDEIKVVTPEGKAMDGDGLKKTQKGHEIKIEYTEKDGVKTAVRVVEKPPVKLPAEMLISTAEVERLVALGPEKGKYFLYDSRPLPRIQQGMIPTAISLPFPAFDKMVGKLPKEKDALIVFYCAGPSCNMSPGSATKAKALGYTNIKVYVDGMPAWLQKNHGVLPVQFLKDAWIDKGASHVLLDVRSDEETARGFIKGAVAFPAAQAEKLVKDLPPKEKKPPVIVYDAKDGSQAEIVAKAAIKAGYKNVQVLSGGFAAWQGAKFEAASGKPAVKATYERKLLPGEISIDEFSKIAAQIPANVVIVDVRNPDETAKGTLKGAKLVPSEELKDRKAELPKDKLIVTHCSTGTRAEMAYHAIKELGFSNVKFLNAKVDFDKSGAYKISTD